MFYAYLHCRPDGSPFYVGKGAGTRATTFRRQGNHYYNNVVKKHGGKNILVGKLDCSTEALAFELERGLIKCLRRMGVKLCNMTDGGEGPSGSVQSQYAKDLARKRCIETPIMSRPGVAEKQAASMRATILRKIAEGTFNWEQLHGKAARKKAGEARGKTQRMLVAEGKHHLQTNYPFAGKPDLRIAANKKISEAKQAHVASGTHNFVTDPPTPVGYRHMLDLDGVLRHVKPEHIHDRLQGGWVFKPRTAKSIRLMASNKARKGVL